MFHEAAQKIKAARFYGPRCTLRCNSNVVD